MTGFARVREAIRGVDVVLSIKSVNHRGLDLHFYMGPEMDPVENAMRDVLKRQVSRGHVDVRVQLSNGAAAVKGALDMTRLAAYVSSFYAAREKYGLSGEPDLNSALRIPGMLGETAAIELPEGFEAGIVSLLERALEELNAFRAREGAELVRVMLERNAAIHAGAIGIEELRSAIAPALQLRMRERLGELLGSAQIDPQRVAQEAAMLADRSDIGEEIARLRIHSRQVEEILTGGAEVGKKLDFLLQEMNRETNTILSKTAGVGGAGLRITELALAAKSDIEKLREQSLNLE
jgi:uncharacterized protein (TIGR00255 family)